MGDDKLINALSGGTERQTPMAHSHTHSHPHTHAHTETKAILNRLAKIIGHLESVRRMVEDDRDCSQVLMQIAAVRSALDSTAKLILKDHMQHCLVDIVNSGDTESLDELNKAIDMLIP